MVAAVYTAAAVRSHSKNKGTLGIGPEITFLSLEESLILDAYLTVLFSSKIIVKQLIETIRGTTKQSGPPKHSARP